MEACRRFAQALAERVRGSARPLAAALLAAGALTASPAPAANPGRLNIGIAVQGVAGISDLNAAAGLVPGDIELTWTEPQRSGTSAPYSYDVRVSTTGQIGTHAQFLAAQPISQFSSSPLPAPGPGGGQAGLTVTGLVPGVIHYFAIRELDAGALFGAWFRGGSKNWNLFNFAPASSATPNPVTNLTALAGPGDGQVALSWTAPGPPTLAFHEVRFATFSVASVGGSTAAWLAQTQSSVVAAGVGPGGLQTATLDLEPAERYYFAVRSSNTAGMGALDQFASGTQVEARARGVGPVTTLAASAGPASNQVTLSWTTPFVSSTTAPLAYQLKVSTVGFIDGTTDFLSAANLSAFSATPLPSYGTPGGAASLTVDGLAPGVTHYFALRVVDGSTPTLAGVWLRAPGLGRNANPSAAPGLTLQPPLAVTNLSALPGGAEGEVALTWTAPSNPNLVAISSYEVRFATQPATAFVSTTAWWNAASSQAYSGALSPGALESRAATGLLPTATWYFAVVSIDATGQVSPIDSLSTGAFQARALPHSVAPSVPAGLAATADLRAATVSWTDLTPAGKGLDFAFYRLERSSALPSFVGVTTTTATSYFDSGLKAKVTYYYRVSARDLRGNESVAASTVSAIPFTLRPMEPLGVTVTPASATATFAWSPTTRFGNGLSFLVPGSPDEDELQGYSLYRSTDVCASSYALVSTMTAATLNYADYTGGLLYYYKLTAFNTEGVSTSPVIVSSLGDRSVRTDDCASFVTIDVANAAVLNAQTNGLGSNVRLVGDRRPQDVGGTVFQSVQFRAMLDGATPIKNFTLPRPARLSLRFQVAGGAPVPSTAPVLSGLSAQSAGAAPANFTTKDLGMFWDNGAEFKKMYGVVDPVAQTVTVETPNLGTYQIRAQYRPGGTVFDLSNVSHKAFTPNGDGLNDVFIITYDPGAGNASVSGKIYDVTGRHVADMTPGRVPNTLVWDGRMNGRYAAGGVYVYKIEGGGKTYAGSIVVAR